MDKTEIKIGMEVWYEDSYGNVCSGKVIKILEDVPGYAEVRGTRSTYGTQGVKICECHRTMQGLLNDIKAKSCARVQAYCDGIKDVAGLVEFMYSHTVSGAEEYTDWDARRAAAIRARDLLGIELEPDA